MIWFPWQQMLTGAILLVVALAIMRRQQDSFGLGRTAKFLMFAGIAAAALWAGATFPGVDDYLHRSFEPNAFFRSFVPFFIVWAIANARNLKRRAHNLPETLASFAATTFLATWRAM